MLGEFYLSALAESENTICQTEVMNKNGNELQGEITRHSANALKLFDAAKRIQQQLFQIPFPKRQSAMNQVRILEQEAVREAHKSLALEKQLSQPKSK